MIVRLIFFSFFTSCLSLSNFKESTSYNLNVSCGLNPIISTANTHGVICLFHNSDVWARNVSVKSVNITTSEGSKIEILSPKETNSFVINRDWKPIKPKFLSQMDGYSINASSFYSSIHKKYNYETGHLLGPSRQISTGHTLRKVLFFKAKGEIKPSTNYLLTICLNEFNRSGHASPITECIKNKVQIGNPIDPVTLSLKEVKEDLKKSYIETSNYYLNSKLYSDLLESIGQYYWNYDMRFDPGDIFKPNRPYRSFLLEQYIGQISRFLQEYDQIKNYANKEKKELIEDKYHFFKLREDQIVDFFVRYESDRIYSLLRPHIIECGQHKSIDDQKECYAYFDINLSRILYVQTMLKNSTENFKNVYEFGKFFTKGNCHK